MLKIYLFLLSFNDAFSAENICNGTDTIDCKINVPKFSQKEFKVEHKKFMYIKGYQVLESKKKDEADFKDYILQSAREDAVKDFEKIELDKNKYDKIECIIEKTVLDEQLTYKKNDYVSGLNGGEYARESMEYYSYKVYVDCSIFYYVPIEIGELKSFQCIEAQRCLSAATTVKELKKIEAFRDALCNSNDTIFLRGEGGKRIKDKKLESPNTSPSLSRSIGK